MTDLETFYPSEVVDIDSLIPYPGNYNQHGEKQLGHLSESLDQFGQFKNIIAWRQYIMAGHGLVLSAKARGWRRIEIKRMPSEWSEEKAEAVLIADNEIARQSDPNQESLAALLQEIGQADAKLLGAAGFGQRELDQLLAKLGPPIDPNAEWVGMPGFEQEDVFGAIASIKVHFASKEDIESFSGLVGQTVNEHSKFIWYPKKEPENLKAYLVHDES